MIVDNDGMCTLDDEDKSYHSNMIRKRTNADKIRAMTDEELADIARYLLCDVCPTPDKCKNMANCKQTMLDWLKQEVNENG